MGHRPLYFLLSLLNSLFLAACGQKWAAQDSNYQCFYREETLFSKVGGAESGAVGAESADAHLARLVAAWPHLDESARQAFMAIIGAAAS